MTNERLEALIRHGKVRSPWSRFADTVSFATAVLTALALLVAIAAWWTVLPTVGFLWLVGAL